MALRKESCVMVGDTNWENIDWPSFLIEGDRDAQSLAAFLEAIFANTLTQVAKGAARIPGSPETV